MFKKDEEVCKTELKSTCAGKEPWPFRHEAGPGGPPDDEECVIYVLSQKKELILVTLPSAYGRRNFRLLKPIWAQRYERQFWMWHLICQVCQQQLSSSTWKWGAPSQISQRSKTADLVVSLRSLPWSSSSLKGQDRRNGGTYGQRSVML